MRLSGARVLLTGATGGLGEAIARVLARRGASLPGFIRDAGMFAESGATLPAGVRSSTPRDVAVGVLRAIERDRAEVIVAPPEMRVGALLGSIAPGLSATMQRLAGAYELNGAMSEGNRSKRWVIRICRRVAREALRYPRPRSHRASSTTPTHPAVPVVSP